MRDKSEQQAVSAKASSTGHVRSDVNARFRDVRDALGMSNADVARGSGLTRAYISRIVNDQTNVGVDLLIFLAKQHGVSIDWLLTGKGPMFQRPSGYTNDFETLRMELRHLRETVERYVVKSR